MKYKYKLVRSDRRTLSVTVCSDNSITVRAPRDTSVEKIEKFLQSKSSWLDKKIEANNRISSVNFSVKAFETVLIRGENIPLVIGGANAFNDGVLYVKTLLQMQKVLRDNFGGEFLERFYSFAEACGFKVSSVKFRSYKARWGCCDGNRNIIFNYKILMLPVPLQDYIIIHELCHTKYMNHSARFWAEVKRYCCDFSNKRKLLKEYAFLTRLYP